MRLFTWLKYQRVADKNNKVNRASRYIGMALCFMQCFASLLTQTFYSIQVAQDLSLRMIIKGFATISIVVNIDD
jgi:hypothetical protein